MVSDTPASQAHRYISAGKLAAPPRYSQIAFL